MSTTLNGSFVNKASAPPVIEIDSFHTESTTSNYGNLSSITSTSDDKNMVDTTKATVLSVIIFFTIFGE